MLASVCSLPSLEMVSSHKHIVTDRAVKVFPTQRRPLAGALVRSEVILHGIHVNAKTGLQTLLFRVLSTWYLPNAMGNELAMECWGAMIFCHTCFELTKLKFRRCRLDLHDSSLQHDY